MIRDGLGPSLLLSGCEAPESDPGPDPDPATLADRLAEARLVDLTHPFGDETLVWPGSEPFEFEIVFEGMTDDRDFYLARKFSGPEHGGTHLDAPIHFAEGAWTVDEIPLERLIGPGAVVDVSEAAGADPNHQVTVEDLTGWEEAHGRIPNAAFLLLSTGRSSLWPDAEAYMGTARQDEEGTAELEFPGLRPDAARWLVENRDVAAVGIDTPSLDHGPSTTFGTHVTLMAENLFGLENLARLEELPATGATILALPVLLEGGSGRPIRVVAVVV